MAARRPPSVSCRGCAAGCYFLVVVVTSAFLVVAVSAALAVVAVSAALAVVAVPSALVVTAPALVVGVSLLASSLPQAERP